MLFDNLKKGDVVCLIGVRGEDTEKTAGNYSGVPFLVDALNWPFVVARPATDETYLASFDLRVHQLTKANRAYYNTFVFNTYNVNNSISECPVCREGCFRLIHEASSRPYFRCTVCKSIVNEVRNVR